MGRRADYTVLVTNAAGTSVLCDPVGTSDPATGKPGWTAINLGPRRMQVGAGSLEVAAMPQLIDAVTAPGARLVVYRDLEDGSGPVVQMAGPVEEPPAGWQAATDGEDGYGRVTVTFADDMQILTRATVYPNPAQAATGQTVAKYTAAAVNPETLMRTLVNANVGPGALVARRTPGFTLRGALGLYPGVTVSTSWTRDTLLMDALRDVDALAVTAGATLGVGVRVVQTPTGLQFQTYQPQDLSASIVFSRAMGNVADLQYMTKAPTVTVALVGDAGAGVGRTIRERVNTAAIAAGWPRIEAFVDARGASNAGEMDAEGDKTLADYGPKASVQLTAIETSQMRYGYDYGPGDQVSVQPYPGGPFVTARCQGADIAVTPAGGETVTPIIGTEDGIPVDAKTAEFRALWRTVQKLQGSL